MPNLCEHFQDIMLQQINLENLSWLFKINFVSHLNTKPWSDKRQIFIKIERNSHHISTRCQVEEVAIFEYCYFNIKSVIYDSKTLIYVFQVGRHDSGLRFMACRRKVWVLLAFWWVLEDFIESFEKYNRFLKE